MDFSPVIVQKGHCERQEPTELPAQVSQNSTDFSTRMEIRARKGGVGEQGSVK